MQKKWPPNHHHWHVQHLLVTTSFRCCPWAVGSSTCWTRGTDTICPFAKDFTGLFSGIFEWNILLARGDLASLFPLPVVPQGFACSLLSFFTGTRSWSVFCNHVLLLPVCPRCHFVKRAPVTLCNAILLYMKMNTAISKSRKRNSSIKLK